MSHQIEISSLVKKGQTVTSEGSKENVDKRKNKAGESMSEVAGPSRDVIPKKKMRVVVYNGDQIVSEYETPPTSIAIPQLQFLNSQGDEVKLEKSDESPSTTPITSQMIAAREAIKTRIGYGLKKGETDDKLMDDERFKIAMKNLRKAPITCIYKGSTTTVIWENEEQMLGFNDGKPHGTKTKGSKIYKCKVAKCFVTAVSLPNPYCRGHGIQLNYIVRDLTSTTTSLGFITPSYSKEKGFSAFDLKKHLQGSTAKQNHKSLYNHFHTQGDAAKIKVDYSWSLSPENVIGGEGSAHKMVALSFMTMMHNSLCDDDKDKIHLINQDVVFTTDLDVHETDFFPKLLAILTANGFKFSPTNEIKSTSDVPTSLLAKVSYKNLPNVYQTKDEDDGRVYVGLRWGNAAKIKGEGSSSHRNNKKTALTNFPEHKKIRMYQQQHFKIDVVKMVKKEMDLNPTQKLIFEEMKLDAKKKEGLAQVCCIVAKMMGLKVNNFPAKLIFQKYAHFDDAFDLSLFQDFFGYIFGCGVEVEIQKLVKSESGKVELKLF